MNITFAGDWHGTLYQALNAVDKAVENGSEIIIHLGDFGIWKTSDRYLKGLNNALKKADIKLYFVDGNHEAFNLLYAYPIQEDGTRKVRSNIFHLPRGYQFTLDDLSFTAFGGAFSVDRQHRKLNESYWHEELASPEEIDYVLTLPETDILLMHDCPAGLPNFITDDPQAQVRGIQFFGVNAIEQANQYREILRPIPEHLNPTHVFHGHYHVNTTRYYQKPDPAKGHGKVICLDEGGAGTLYNLMHTSTDLLKEERNRLRDAM